MRATFQLTNTHTRLELKDPAKGHSKLVSQSPPPIHSLIDCFNIVCCPISFFFHLHQAAQEGVRRFHGPSSYAHARARLHLKSCHVSPCRCCCPSLCPFLFPSCHDPWSDCYCLGSAHQPAHAVQTGAGWNVTEWK